MPDDFRFVPVEELEGDPPLIIGLSGMSDSGKTYSALLIAQAIARQRGGIVAAIDTEGRMKKYRDSKVYAELHPFKALRWTPPFDGDRAIKACEAAIKAGAGCIILDSASDEWEGDGGVLESHDAYLDREAGDVAAQRHKHNMSGVGVREETAPALAQLHDPTFRSAHPLQPRPAESQGRRQQGDRPRRHADLRRRDCLRHDVPPLDGRG